MQYNTVGKINKIDIMQIKKRLYQIYVSLLTHAETRSRDLVQVYLKVSLLCGIFLGERKKADLKEFLIKTQL